MSGGGWRELWMALNVDPACSCSVRLERGDGLIGCVVAAVVSTPLDLIAASGIVTNVTVCLRVLLNVACAGFMANQSRGQLMGHVDSKHAKLTFEECFPGFVEKA